MSLHKLTSMPTISAYFQDFHIACIAKDQPIAYDSALKVSCGETAATDVETPTIEQ